MLRKFITRSNIISIAIIGFLLWSQGPEWMNNQKSEGTVIPPKLYNVYGEEKQTEFPPQGAKVVTIFWASWCQPCKVEMARLEKSVKSGKIKTHEIIAINPFEEPEVAAKYLKENPMMPFTYIHAPEVTKQLNVTATPTTLFIDRGVVKHRSSGISVLGIWRAEHFLN